MMRSLPGLIVLLALAVTGCGSSGQVANPPQSGPGLAKCQQMGEAYAHKYYFSFDDPAVIAYLISQGCPGDTPAPVEPTTSTIETTTTTEAEAVCKYGEGSPFYKYDLCLTIEGDTVICEPLAATDPSPEASPCPDPRRYIEGSTPPLCTPQNGGSCPPLTPPPTFGLTS